jgi:hypothetical protein
MTGYEKGEDSIAFREMEISGETLSDAIVLWLARYPGKNIEEFAKTYGQHSEEMLAEVRSILVEAMKIDVDWTGRTLIDGGNFVMSTMSDRHPELSDQALSSIRSYYTYLMR